MQNIATENAEQAEKSNTENVPGDG